MILKLRLRKLLASSLFSDSFASQFRLTASASYILLLLGLVTGALSARILGPHGRGEWAAIQSWTLVFASIGSLGLPDALAYYVARNPADRSKYISTWWCISIPLSLVWIVVGYNILPKVLATQSRYTISEAQLFLFLIPLEFLTSVHSALHGSQDFIRWNILRVYKPLLYAVMLFGMLFFNINDVGFIVRGFLLISISAPILTIVLLVYKRERIIFQPTFSVIPRMVTYGLQSVLAAAPRRLNLHLDQLIMAAMFDPAELGLYVAAVTWSLSAGSITSALGSVAFPKIAAGSDVSRRDKFKRMSRIVIIISFIISVPMYLLTPFAIEFLFGVEYRAAVPIARILVLASIPWHITKVLEDGIRGLGYPLITAWAEAGGLFVTAAFLVIMLPLFGLYGAAFSSLIAYSTICVGLYLYLVIRLHIRLQELVILRRSDLAYLRKHLPLLST